MFLPGPAPGGWGLLDLCCVCCVDLKSLSLAVLLDLDDLDVGETPNGMQVKVISLIVQQYLKNTVFLHPVFCIICQYI